MGKPVILCKTAKNYEEFPLLYLNCGHSLVKHENILKFSYAINRQRHIFKGRQKYSHSHESKYCIVKDLPRYLCMPTEAKARPLFSTYVLQKHISMSNEHRHQQIRFRRLVVHASSNNISVLSLFLHRSFVAFLCHHLCDTGNTLKHSSSYSCQSRKVTTFYLFERDDKSIVFRR